MAPPRPDAWVVPDSFPLLTANEIHVWRFQLVLTPFRLQAMEATLSDDELARANRFRGERLRSQFVAGRGTLRHLLGRYLQRPPADVAFCYGPHGKPELAEDASWLSFNLAHSGEIALCAIARGRSVGADVEALRPFENAEKIIQRFFSTAEQAEFLGLPETERFVAFYLGWTRKEAYLKAVGTGLATRLDSFDVTITPGKPATLLRVDQDSTAHVDWLIVDLDPSHGYAGALVVPSNLAMGSSDDVIVRQFDATCLDAIQ